MSIIGSNILAGASGSGVEAYEIEQSLRFEMSATPKLTRTAGTPTDGKKFTVSYWIKKCKQEGGGAPAARFWDAYSGTGNQFHMQFGDGGADILNLSPGELSNGGQSNAQFRDNSAWYHIVWAWDSVNQTFRAWSSGVELTWSNTTTPALNGVTSLTKSGTPVQIGKINANAVDMYLAEVHVVDGQALDHEDFGEYDESGVWRAIEYTGTYGDEGYYLKFDPDATNGIGHDHSGNGNNFTATNFTTSGTGTDVMSDTPTTNYCTLNPLTSDFSYGTVTNGNLDMSGTSSSDGFTSSATQILTTGKYYWETTLTAGKTGAGSYPRFGFLRAVDAGYPDGAGAGYTNSKFQYASQSVAYQSNGSKIIASSETSYGNSYDNTDIIGIAYDGDNGAIYFSKNGTWQNSGDPTSGASKTGAALTWTDDRDYVFQASHYNGTASSFNFGQRDFSYTPPTDFLPLNTSNLPEPTIKNGSEYFNTVLWTGNSTDDRDITGVGFNPDFTWLKERTDANQHELYDAVRGATKRLQSNELSAEDTVTNNLKSFITDGFRLGTAGSVNNASDTYVAWNWLAGNGTSSNTNGSITSTVSVSAASGFSIVSYGGNSTAGATVGHGLGVAPKAFVIKNRDDSVARWCMYHVATGATGYMRLDASPKFIPDGVFNSTAPSSTTFTVSDGYFGNRTGDDYIAYCFAEVENYSRIESYIGNGNADGAYVYCGFRPAWVMIKDTTVDGNSWYISDNKRNTYNVVDGRLMANLSNGESTSVDICDFTANGFKIRTNDSGWNTSGSKYLFLCFAENPFGGSGVSPATAR